MDKFYRNAIFLGDTHFEKNMFFRGGQVFRAYGKIYFVDGTSGLDTNSELSWDEAVKTIEKAIEKSNLTRTLHADNWIIVAPGTYVEPLTALPYACHMIGLGFPGTDKSVKIYPAAGSALEGTVSGLHIYNIRFEAKGAVPIIDFGTCNNVIFENCQFAPALTGPICYIETDNSSHLQIINCQFFSGLTTPVIINGLHFKGGPADKYLHAAIIKGNIISGIKSGGTGINIASNCVDSETVIQDNVIIVPGAGKGIDDNHGKSHCIGNRIFVGASGDCIEHAGGNKMLMDNLVNVNGEQRREPVITTGG